MCWVKAPPFFFLSRLVSGQYFCCFLSRLGDEGGESKQVEVEEEEEEQQQEER